MLFFRSEERVVEWCREQGMPMRPLVSLEQLWRLALTWYATRMSAEARRPAPDEMVSIFAGIGLEGPFWDPAADRWSGGGG